MDGEPEPVMDFYNALIAERENATIRQQPDDHGRIKTLSGTGEARLSSLRIEDERGDAIEWIPVGQTVFLIAHVEVFQAVSDLVFGYQIKDCLGRVIFGTNTHHLDYPLAHLKKGDRLRLEFRFFANLGPGSYSITTALHTGDQHVAHNYEWRDLTTVFTVFNQGKPSFVGVNWMQPISVVQR
jgi:lipopolysaccharide transport system ATP-binding protein